MSKDIEFIECPSCAEDIKAKAKKCRYCGEIIDETIKEPAINIHEEGPNNVKEIFEDINKTLINPPDKEYSEINFKLGLAGGIMAIIGVFCPAFKAFMVGNISFLSLAGKEEGIGAMSVFVFLTIAMGICGIVSSNKNKYIVNINFGGLGLISTVLFYVILHMGLKKHEYTNLSWGWVVLIAASICLILSQTYKSKAV